MGLDIKRCARALQFHAATPWNHPGPLAEMPYHDALADPGGTARGSATEVTGALRHLDSIFLSVNQRTAQISTFFIAAQQQENTVNKITNGLKSLRFKGFAPQN
ncbi:hypothetical protein [Niveibacterium sp.]|uniref:hypothetical protein n=1 Tax=Niveibacterium sp. TaxID=2017444 RepID=UPI0035B2401F